jgi:hypothetical protein
MLSSVLTAYFPFTSIEKCYEYHYVFFTHSSAALLDRYPKHHPADGFIEKSVSFNADTSAGILLVSIINKYYTNSKALNDSGCHCIYAKLSTLYRIHMLSELSYRLTFRYGTAHAPAIYCNYLSLVVMVTMVVVGYHAMTLSVHQATISHVQHMIDGVKLYHCHL